jgi:hypothetical protein
VDRQRQALGLIKPTRSRSREDNQAPVLFDIDSERRLVIVRFGECLTRTDIESYVQSLRTHPSFDSSFSEIADISDVKELPLESSDFLKLADLIDPFSVQSKRAFVAKTSVQKHAARMHKILRSQKNLEIFETLEEAERWISRTE